MFVYIKCRCGRSLRAQRSPEPSTITCWSCGRPVKVPAFRETGGPRPISRLRQLFALGYGETFAAAALMALATVPILMVPRFGMIAALTILTVWTTFYLRRIERSGTQPTPNAEPEPATIIPWPTRIAAFTGRFVLALIFTIGFTIPFALADETAQREPTTPLLRSYVVPIGAFVLWLLLPFLAFLIVARRGNERLGVWSALGSAWKRKGILLTTLFLFPFVFIALEAVLVGIFYATELLVVFVYDLFPVPEPLAITELGSVVKMPEEQRGVVLKMNMALETYLQGLKEGATLLASIPMSLFRGLEPRLRLALILGSPTNEAYLITRIGISYAGLAFSFFILAIQARLLGRIAWPIDQQEKLKQKLEGETVPTTEPSPVA